MNRDRLAYTILAIATLFTSSCNRPCFAQEFQWYYNYQQAQTASKATGKALFIEFSMNNCIYCDKLQQTTLRDSQVKQLIKERTVPVHIQLEADPTTVQIFKITSYPTLVVLKPGDKTFTKIEGYIDAKALQSHLVKLPQQTKKTINRELEKAVVRIESHGASGTVIKSTKDKSYILSCAHMFEDTNGNPSIALQNKPFNINGTETVKPGRARLVSFDYNDDLSLIEIDVGNISTIPVAPEGFTPGTNLQSIGYDEHNKETWPVTDVAVHLISVLSDKTFTVESPWHGRSGGALVDADSKVLIGVVEGYETWPNRRGIYVSHVTVTNFLKKIFGQQPKQQPKAQPKQPNYFPAPKQMTPQEGKEPEQLQTPAQPAEPDHRLDELMQRINRHSEALLILINKDKERQEDETPGKLDSIKSEIEALKSLLKVGDRPGELTGKIDAIDGKLAKLKELKELAQGAKDAAEKVIPVVEKIGPVLNYLGPIIGVTATGGTGALVYFGFLAARGLIGLVKRQKGTESQRDQQRPSESRVEAANQEAIEKTKYVPFKASDTELAGLKRALDEYASRGQAEVTAVEVIKAQAQQLNSGRKQ